MMLRPSRIPRLVVLAVIIAIGVNSVVWAIADWHLSDMHVYQDAALRLRAGDQLYGGDVDFLSAYRYAPWFAYAWVPLTLLPQVVIEVGWSGLLLVGSAVAIWPLVHGPSRSGLMLAALLAPILVGISAIGNVQGPMLALLMVGMPRRWGGIAVGVAASLKLVPLILALIFVAQRRWTQAAVALITTAVLWLPALWLDAAPVTLDPGLARTLPVPAWLTLGGVAVAGAAMLALRRSRHSALGAATAAVLVLPRLFVYDITLVLVGAVNPDTREDKGPASHSEASHTIRQPQPGPE